MREDKYYYLTNEMLQDEIVIPDYIAHIASKRISPLAAKIYAVLLRAIDDEGRAWIHIKIEDKDAFYNYFGENNHATSDAFVELEDSGFGSWLDEDDCNVIHPSLLEGDEHFYTMTRENGSDSYLEREPTVPIPGDFLFPIMEDGYDIDNDDRMKLIKLYTLIFQYSNPEKGTHLVLSNKQIKKEIGSDYFQWSMGKLRELGFIESKHYKIITPEGEYLMRGLSIKNNKQ